MRKVGDGTGNLQLDQVTGWTYRCSERYQQLPCRTPIHKAKQAQVERLQRENAELQARRKALGTPAALEREARRMGMVRPDERPFVVRGLPK